jgi:hypothetical protein
LNYKILNKNEPYLSGINEKTSLIELKNILSLETGESMNLFIKRDDGKIISIKNFNYFSNRLVSFYLKINLKI